MCVCVCVCVCVFVYDAFGGFYFIVLNNVTVWIPVSPMVFLSCVYCRDNVEPTEKCQQNLNIEISVKDLINPGFLWSSGSTSIGHPENISFERSKHILFYQTKLC